MCQEEKRGSLPGERSFCRGPGGIEKAFSSLEQWQKQSQQCHKQTRPSGPCSSYVAGFEVLPPLRKQPASWVLPLLAS